MTKFLKGDYMGMAREWLRGRELIYWNEGWMRWDGGYKRISLHAEAWIWLDKQHFSGVDGDERVLPNKSMVANLFEAAEVQRIVSHRVDLQDLVAARRKMVREALALADKPGGPGAISVLREAGGMVGDGSVEWLVEALDPWNFQAVIEACGAGR